MLSFGFELSDDKTFRTIFALLNLFPHLYNAMRFKRALLHHSGNGKLGLVQRWSTYKSHFEEPFNDGKYVYTVYGTNLGGDISHICYADTKSQLTIDLSFRSLEAWCLFDSLMRILRACHKQNDLMTMEKETTVAKALYTILIGRYPPIVNLCNVSNLHIPYFIKNSVYLL